MTLCSYMASLSLSFSLFPSSIFLLPLHTHTDGYQVRSVRRQPASSSLVLKAQRRLPHWTIALAVVQWVQPTLVRLSHQPPTHRRRLIKSEFVSLDIISSPTSSVERDIMSLWPLIWEWGHAPISLPRTPLANSLGFDIYTSRCRTGLATQIASASNDCYITQFLEWKAFDCDMSHRKLLSFLLHDVFREYYYMYTSLCT